MYNVNRMVTHDSALSDITVSMNQRRYAVKYKK